MDVSLSIYSIVKECSNVFLKYLSAFTFRAVLMIGIVLGIGIFCSLFFLPLVSHGVFQTFKEAPVIASVSMISIIVILLCWLQNLFIQFYAFSWEALHNKPMQHLKFFYFTAKNIRACLVYHVFLGMGAIFFFFPFPTWLQGLLFGIAFFYMMIRLSLFYPFIVLEEDSVFDALKKSWHYTAGHFPELIILMVIIFLLMIVRCAVIFAFIATPFVALLETSLYKHVVKEMHIS